MAFRRSSPRARTRWFVLLGAVMAMTVLIGTTVLASHDIDVLTGSNFEIDVDANIKVDDPAPSQDWASIPQGSAAGEERRAQDDESGQQDDSFGQGTKEDDAIPTVTAGGKRLLVSVVNDQTEDHGPTRLVESVARARQ